MGLFGGRKIRTGGTVVQGLIQQHSHKLNGGVWVEEDVWYEINVGVDVVPLTLRGFK